MFYFYFLVPYIVDCPSQFNSGLKLNSLSYDICTGTKIRTRNNGFGDRYDTISLYPCMLARHQGLEPWPFGLEPKMLNHYTNDAYILWSRRVTIPFLWIFSPAQWPHLPQLLILGVWPVTIRLSSFSQNDDSTILSSHTIYFVTPVGYDPTLPILKVWCFPD